MTGVGESTCMLGGSTSQFPQWTKAPEQGTLPNLTLCASSSGGLSIYFMLLQQTGKCEKINRTTTGTTGYPHAKEGVWIPSSYQVQKLIQSGSKTLMQEPKL